MAAKGLSDATKAVFATVKAAHAAGEQLTAKEIAERSGLGARQITGCVNALVKKEVVERTGETGDKDRKIVLINPDFDPDFVPEAE